MKVLDLLKGKRVRIMTDTKVEVELEIETVIESRHSRDLAPATSKNDWWPPTEDWVTYDVKFTNGFLKSYASLNAINLVDN